MQSKAATVAQYLAELPPDRRQALELLRESAGLKRARETVRGYAEQARGHLALLPDAPARRALESLADVIADRTA